MYNNTLNPIDSIPDVNNLEPEEQFENMTPNERVNLTNAWSYACQNISQILYRNDPLYDVVFKVLNDPASSLHDLERRIKSLRDNIQSNNPGVYHHLDMFHEAICRVLVRIDGDRQRYMRELVHALRRESRRERRQARREGRNWQPQHLWEIGL